MNVVQGRRKRTTAQRNRDYQDFNRINPIGADPNQINRLLENQSNDVSFTTLATRGNSVGRQSSTYLSLASGRGYAHGEVGIAYIDIESPMLKLIQLSDDPWYSALLMKIHIIDPCHIIVPHTIYDAKPETSDGKLIKFIREEFPKLGLLKVPRRHFNETDGMDLVAQYCSEKYDFVKEDIDSKYYALSAASGLLKYLQYIHNIYFKENGLKLECETKFAHLRIDIDTSYKLELLGQSNPNMVKSSFPSLFDVLDHCVTSLGKRMLRARILEPMCDIPSIKDFQDCITELNQPENVELSPSLTHVLSNFNNIERLHKLVLVVPQDDNIRAAEILINQALHLKKCLQLIPVLQGRLSPLISKKFQEIQANLMDERYTSILNQINTVINKNLLEFQKDSNSQLFQRINCVQNGVNDLIDILRKSYNELIGQIETLVGDMSVKYGLAFRLNYTIQRGFHVQHLIGNNAAMRDFPDEIEILEMKRNTCSLTTADINKYNIRIRNVIEEIIIQSNVVIAAMLNGIIKEIDAIYDLSAFTATLDIILSFAMASNNGNFVCPTFGDEMRIIDAVHPLLEQSIHQTVPTPNNIIATPEYNFFIITGPNMSGKTVYLKTIAILQIMAQLGCFVPAKSAQFRITDRIFSRMGFNDSIEKNLSTFMTEMNNMEHILKNVTPNSLLIIDELCRSTNPKEGSQLAWNICEYLASIRGIFNDGKYFVNDEPNHTTQDGNARSDDGPAKESVDLGERASTMTRSSAWKNSKLTSITAPFIFLTTHFHSLTKLSNPFFNVVNLSFSAEQISENVDENDGQPAQLKYNHRIQEGVTTTTSYGLAIAKTLRFTPDLLNKAIEINRNFITGENTQSSHQSLRKRTLSNVSRQILQMNCLSQIGRIDNAASVVSSAINTSRRRRRFTAQQEGLSGASGLTSNSVYEDQLKIDRIFYNAYGDIMSLSRTTEIDWMDRYNDENNYEADLQDVQNQAIARFLMDFAQEQPDGLIEAVVNLNLSHEMPEPPVEREANEAETAQIETPLMNGSIAVPDSNPSTIYSVQRIIHPHPQSVSEPIRKATPIQPRERSISRGSSRGSGAYSIENVFKPRAPANEINSRMTSSPRAPVNASLRVPSSSRSFVTSPISSAIDAFQGTIFASSNRDHITSSSSSSSTYMSCTNSSPRSQSTQYDPYLDHESPDFKFENFQTTPDFDTSHLDVEFNPSQMDSHSQFSGQFSQSFNRSQSQCDLFDAPSNSGNLFASGYFSQHDINEFGNATSTLPSQSFQMPSFSSQISSQRQQPNLSNIRRVAQASRSLADLPTAFHSGSSSSNPKSGQFSWNNSTFRSIDNSPSNSGDSEKSRRRMPLIQKAKLKAASVFGSTSNLFSTQSKVNVPPKGTSANHPPKQVNTQNRLNHGTETNFAAAMELLKKKCARIMTSAARGNQTIQQNATDQSPTNKQTDENDTIDDEFMPPPPAGFD